jgi:hypothetical protein
VRQTTKNALKRAKDELDKIKEEQGVELIGGLSALLLTYLAEKWNVSTAEITRSWISEKGEQGKIDVPTTNELLAVLDIFDGARFGVGAVHSAEEMIARTEKILVQIDKGHA